jgi:hypothetical protein
MEQATETSDKACDTTSFTSFTYITPKGPTTYT